MQSNVKPCNTFEFLHISSSPATLASHYLHDTLVDQLYAKEMYFCSFVRNRIKHRPNIHQMYLTVSIEPSRMESSIRFSQVAPPPQPPTLPQAGFALISL